MSKKVLFAVLACAFTLCLGLAGCGSGGGNNAAKEAFAGTWDLVEMNENGNVTTREDLETLKAFGLEVYVNLNEDDTAALVLFGESIDGSWVAKSETEGTLTLADQAVNMTIADGQLTFEQEGSSLTFEKGEAKDTPKAEASASASASASSSAS